MTRRAAVSALRTIVLVTVAAGAWLALYAPPAGAHALLIHADPAPNATLSQSPSQLVLTFTEPIEPSLSLIDMVDTRGRPVPDVATSRPVPGNPAQLRAAITTPLPKGVYTVNWRTVSAVDGHEASDSYAFGVDVAGVGTIAPFGKFATTTTWLNAASAAGRWLLYWGLALFVGAAATSLLALAGRFPNNGRAVLRTAWLSAAAGVFTVALAEKAIVHAPSLLPLLHTAVGHSLSAQGIAVLVCGASVVGADLWPGRWTMAAVGVAGAAALFVHIQAGHANGPSSLRPLNLAEQWVHVTAVGVWIGGLVWLLLGIRGLEREPRNESIRRYSSIATVAIVVVALTGLLRAISETRSFGALVNTSFGVALLVKVALFLGLAFLGAVNHYRLAPRLPGSESLLTRFRRTSQGELAVAAAVFAATGVLTGLAPANFATAAAGVTAGHRLVASGTDYATTVRVQLTVTPGTVGRNSYALQVDDYTSDKPLAAARTVQLQMTLPSHPTVGPQTVTLNRLPSGTWQGQGLQLSIAGQWTVDVVVQEPATAVVIPLGINVALP
jgi:copper transport protein